MEFLKDAEEEKRENTLIQIFTTTANICILINTGLTG
jgi:hypothetical protein